MSFLVSCNLLAFPSPVSRNLPGLPKEQEPPRNREAGTPRLFVITASRDLHTMRRRVARVGNEVPRMTFLFFLPRRARLFLPARRAARSGNLLSLRNSAAPTRCILARCSLAGASVQ